MSPFDLERWFVDAIPYFRALGFFASRQGSDDELGEAIKSYWRGDWDEYLAAVSDQPSADQLLLVADTERVWWHDLEGVYKGANYYVEVLNEWAAISRGQFAPQQIHEKWHSEKGPVEVNFLLNGSQHTFMHRSGDFLEHVILKLINQALPNKFFSFEVAIDYGDSNWIAMLNPNEKQRLKIERGWSFLW